MMKKLTALTALMLVCVLLLTGCLSTEGLKKMPQGQRPEGGFRFEEMNPEFPSNSAVKNQLMMLGTDVRTAKDIDTMRAKYDELMHDAFIYVVGPYNYVQYLAQDGRSMSAYYDNMVGHINLLLTEWEPNAWTAITESEFGAQLKSEYAGRMCTPDSIRNTYPTSDETVSTQLQNMYSAREAFAEGIANGFAETDKELLLDDLFASREALANTLLYDSYPQYVVEKRDKAPYDLDSLLKLAQIVKENLAPAVKAAEADHALDMTAQEWNEKLPALAQRFPAYSEDLLYVLECGAYAAEDVQEAYSRHFAYQLYQYDFSTGKAKLADDEEEALHVLYGLGLEARNMALETEQWSLSELALYDAVQESAFAAMCINELDALGVDAQKAKEQLIYLMAKDVCCAAMELELLVELHKNPVMAQGDREALIAELSESYGADGKENYFEQSEDVIMGTMECVGRMMGGLYGLTLHKLDNADSALADKVLEATLSVYNAGNPIAVGYAAGLENPFSTDGVKAVAEMVK